MSHPVFWPKKTFFYAIGNTSAINFAQDLSPEQGADVLLLGSGDCRSILYTIHADLQLENNPGLRALDFTCCDVEPAIFARNILLLTLILEKAPQQTIWNIFYHFYLDQNSLEVLEAHCQKLCKLASDLDSWRTSKFSFIKFATNHTFNEIRKHWELYAAFPHLVPDEHKRLKKLFSTKMKNVLENYKDTVMTSFRAAGPLFMANPIILSNHFNEFWKTGVTVGRVQTDKSPTPHINPTFSISGSNHSFNVHYGSDPILGFHFAPRLAQNTSLTTKDMVDYARSEFANWCSSFEQRLSRPNSHPNVNIRFVVSDALSICRGLEYCRKTGAVETPFTTSAWGGQPLMLQADEYSPNSCHRAPMTFHVIETSNLTDHVGLLNLLAVTIPVLSHLPSAVIHTNTLLPADHDHSQRSGLEDKLCADLPTLSILLGLSPTQALSHFTPHSNKHEVLSLAVSHQSQIHELISWRKPFVHFLPTDTTDTVSTTKNLSCDAVQLGNFFFSLYLKMFSSENVTALLPEKPNRSTYVKQTLIHYDRGSIVVFISLIKERVQTNWGKAINHFLSRVTADRTLLVGPNYYQDLCCQVYMHGLHLADTFFPMFLEPQASKNPRFKTWKNLPAAICVVLKVPRERIKPVEAIPLEKINTPILQGESQGPNFQNCHSGIQCTFGDFTVSTVDGEHKVAIKEDADGWAGDSALIITFYMPTWILTLDPSSTKIGLSFRSSPDALKTLAPTLGFMLHIFFASVLDESHIQFTRSRPGFERQVGQLQIPVSLPDPASAPSAPTSRTTVNFDPLGSNITSIALWRDIDSSASQQLLLGGAQVVTEQIQDSLTSVKFEGFESIFVSPFPLKASQLKTRIARKSHYIEVEAPPRPSFEDVLDLSLNPFPISRYNNAFHLLNVHYVNLDRLPALKLPNNVSKWLMPHCGMMLSKYEKDLQARRMDEMGALIGLKESIASILYHFTGVQTQGNQRQNYFRIVGSSAHCPLAFVVVNEFRFDLPSHTVIADACVVCANDDIVRRLAAMFRTQPVVDVRLSKEEAVLWKSFLPAIAERCRTWTHSINCEYLTQGIPLSASREEVSLFCSCGKGKNLGAFANHPVWKHFAGEAVRVAFSPLFSFSFINLENPVPAKPQKVDPPDALKCANCKGPGKPNLSTCSLCMKTKYCSRECQKAHWKVHKQSCTK